MTLKDQVDPAVGVRLRKKVGDAVCCGDVVGLVMTNDAAKGRDAVEEFQNALIISDTPPSARRLILSLVEPEEGEKGEFS